MFFVATNKKTKGPTLMELFTATGKQNKGIFFTTRDVRCMYLGWHGTHRYDIQVLATNVGAWISLYMNSNHLAAEMWTTMKNNFMGVKNFELFLLSVQVS
jgi:hypothetical protein